MPEPGGGGWGGREGIIARVQMLLDEESARQVEQEFEKAGQAGGESFRRGLSPALDAIKGMFEGLVAGIAGFFTARFLVDFARDSVQAYQVGERAANAYRVAAERVHTAHGQILSDIEQMRELAKVTPYGEEEILRAGEQLVVILKDERLAMEALPTVLDVAAARHMDLFRAASLVGGAINGNRMGLGYLKLTIDDNLAVLPQLRAQVGGTATNLTAMDRATRLTSETWHDFRKAVGQAIVEGGNGITVLDALTGILQGMTRWVKENQVVFDSLGVTVRIVAGALGLFADGLRTVSYFVSGTFMVVIAGLSGALGGVVRGLQGVATGWAWMLEKVGDEKGSALWRKRAGELKDFADQMQRISKASAGEAGTLFNRADKRWAAPGAGLSFVPGIGWVDPLGNVVQADTTSGLPIGVPGSGGPEKGAKGRGAEAAEAMAKAWEDAYKRVMEATEKSDKEVVEFTNELAATQAKFTETMIDDMEAAYAKVVSDLTEKFPAGIPAAWRDVLEKMRAQIDEVKVIEPLQEEIASLEPLLGKSLDADVVQANIDVIDERIGIVEEHLRGLALAGADPDTIRMWETLLRHLQSLRSKEAKQLAEALGIIPEKVDEGSQATVRWEDSLIAVLSVVQNIGAALLGVLDTLGLSNNEVRQLVGGFASAASIVSHGLSINPKTGKAFGFDFGAVTGLVGAGLSVLSGIGGLLGFGESAEEKAHREALEANNIRLQELRMAVERLTTTMSGATASAITQALGDIIAANVGKSGEAEVSQADLMAWLEKRGISWADFSRAASEMGITLTPGEKITLDQLKALYTAMGSLQTVGGPGGSFGQRLEALRTAQGAATTPPSTAQQLQGYLNLLASAAPQLFAGWRGADLSDPAVVARLQAYIAEMAKNLAEVGVPLSALGDLNEEQFRQAIADMAAGTKQLQEEAKQRAVEGEEAGVKQRDLDAFGKEVSDAIDAATKRGGPAADQARRVADLYQSWLNIRATAAGGPEGALANEAYEKLQEGMKNLDALMGTTAGVGPELTPGWSVVRTFSQVSADVVTGELRTHTVWLERIEGHLAAMRDVIAPRVAGGVSIGALTITGPSYMQNPSAWGAAAADAFANEVDQRLGARYQNGAVLAGNAALP